jgi:hypothetical protein
MRLAIPVSSSIDRKMNVLLCLDVAVQWCSLPSGQVSQRSKRAGDHWPQAGIIPNLDSIAEFRILSSNVDAEYRSFAGGIINVVTKSGSNAFPARTRSSSSPTTRANDTFRA